MLPNLSMISTKLLKGIELHIAPTKVDEIQRSNIERISSDVLWPACEQSIKKSLE